MSDVALLPFSNDGTRNMLQSQYGFWYALWSYGCIDGTTVPLHK